MNPQQFVDKWQHVTLKEKSFAQELHSHHHLRNLPLAAGAGAGKQGDSHFASFGSPTESDCHLGSRKSRSHRPSRPPAGRETSGLTQS